MKNNLIYYLFITLSIIVNSCSEGFKEEYLKISIVLAEVTAITTPTTDTTPDYTFSSTESGAITYGGSCSSSTTIATTGNNTITLITLSVGTYADCTITVSKTISTENSEKKLSGSLTITSFTVSSSNDTTAPVIAEVTAVTNPTNDKTPDYTFSSTEAGTITYGGSCSSSTTSATTDNNTITFSTLDNGTYSDCTIKVTDSSGNGSNTLAITDFTVTYWELIARQADINAQEFDSGAKTSFLEHEDDPSNSTFMSIGNLTPSNYVSDGKYKFKLVWGGETNVEDLSIKEIIWTQTSWLTDSTVTGLQEIPDNGTSDFIDATGSSFDGLLKSTDDCVLDGNQGGGWYHCIGMARGQWHGGIPGPRSKIATSMHLYIWKP